MEEFPWFPAEQSSVVTTGEGARQGQRAREAGQGQLLISRGEGRKTKIEKFKHNI